VGHGLEAVRFVAVAAGGHTLGITQSGEVWVWGRNSSDGGGGHGSAPVADAGQLGHGVAGRPGRAGGALLSAGGATSVAAGRYHSAAAAGGVAYTWGLNDQGQLGRGATHAPHAVRRCHAPP
jgi:alpha-tubulin suppressor-like RCC1 family protein